MASPFDNIHYDAFISYRHNPKDEYVAKNLQEMLETYVVPDNVKDHVQKEKISRIFRDKDELPLSDNLGSSIENALKNSDYLIVICSPTYRESKWCMKEIETFISQKGYGKIILVLCEGTTETSFPPQLLRADVEPFASDVRGMNNKETMDKLKVEYIRVAASLLNVPYDTLRQREQERILRRKAKKMRNAAIITGVVAALSIAALTIISLQKRQLVINNIVSLLEEADDEYLVGDINSSNEDIIEASDYSKKYGGMFDGTIQNKLARNLGVYGTDTEYKPVNTVQMGSEIVNVKFSDDKKHILLADKTGSIKVISTEEFGREDFSTNNAKSGIGDSLSAGFLDNNTIYYVGEKDKLMLGSLDFDEEDQALAYLITQKNRKLAVSPNKQYLAVAVDLAVEIYDAQSLELVYSDYLKPEEYNTIQFNSYITFLDDEKVLYSVSDIKTDTKYENESTEEEIVTIYDFAKDKYRNYTTGICKTVYATLIDNRLYLCYKMFANGNDIPTIRLSCIDYDDGMPLWNADFGDVQIDGIHRTKQGNLLVATGTTIMNLDPETGDTINVYNMGDAHMLSFEDCQDGSVKVLTSKGQEIILKVSDDNIVMLEKKEMMDTTSLKTVVKENDVIYGVPEGKTSIINKYEMSSLPISEQYEGETIDLQYSDATIYEYEPGEVVAAYGTPCAKLLLPDNKYNIYSFENGRVLTVEKEDRAIIDEVMLDFTVEVEAGKDAYGNSYYAEKSGEAHYGGAIAVSEDGMIISTYNNFGGIGEDGKRVILNTQIPETGERELRLYPIYSYKELLDMVK